MIGLVLLLLLSLLGCEQNRQGGEEETEGTPESPSQTDSAGFVPQERTGIREQYLATLQNSFECTDTGVYFMCQDMKGDSFLLYGDHGSDTLVSSAAGRTVTTGARTATLIFQQVDRVFATTTGIYT